MAYLVFGTQGPRRLGHAFAGTPSVFAAILDADAQAGHVFPNGFFEPNQSAEALELLGCDREI
jgi:hypothetical protein